MSNVICESTIAMNKIDIIIEKLNELRGLDNSFKAFGSKKHKYIMSEVVSLAETESFENQYKIKLPSDYREFLIRVGNGGGRPILWLGKFER